MPHIWTAVLSLKFFSYVKILLKLIKKKAKFYEEDQKEN